VDEEALREVAATTGGEYFKASDADQLDGVLRDLPKHVDVQQRDVEVSVAFAGLAALLLVGGLWLAGRWSGVTS
jgi:Ca-activated chloride channel family protein